MVPGVRGIPTPLVSNEAEGDVRRRLVIYEQQEPKYLQEIEVLRRQVQLLAHRSAQLKAEKANAQHNTQIWQRRVEEQQQQISERDQAIANLLRHTLIKPKSAVPSDVGQIENNKDATKVKHTSTQLQQQQQEEPLEPNHHKPQQTKGTKQQENVNRQHESILKLKDDVIADLQRQVRQLIANKNQLMAAQTSQVSNLTREVQRLRSDLELKEQECNELREKDHQQMTHCHERNILERDSKLRSSQFENESLMAELRELKRGLWKAKESTKQVPVLKKALDDAREQIRIQASAHEKAMEEARHQMEEQVRTELQAAEQTHRYLEERLSRMEAEEVSMKQQIIAKQEESIAQLEENVRDLTQRLESRSTLLQECQTKLQGVEEELELERARLEEKVQTELHAAEKTHRYLEERLSRMHAAEVSMNQQTIAKQGESIAHLEETVRDLSHRLESKSTTLQECQTKVQCMEVELELERARLGEKVQTELQAAEKTHRYVEERMSRMHAAEVSMNHQAIAKQQECIAQLEETVRDLSQHLESKSTLLQECQGKLRGVEVDLDRERARLEEKARTDLQAAEQARRHLEERLSRMHGEEVSKKQRTIAKREESIAQLEDTVRDLTERLESKSILLQECQQKLQHVEVEQGLERARWEERVQTDLEAAEQAHRCVEERLSRMHAAEVSMNHQTIAKQQEYIAQLEETVRDLSQHLESKSTLLQECQAKLQSVEVEQGKERARLQEKVRTDLQAAEEAHRHLEERLSRVHAEEVSKKQRTIAKREESIAQLEYTVRDLTERLESKSSLLQECQQKLQHVEVEQGLERARLEERVQTNLEAAEQAHRHLEERLSRIEAEEVSKRQQTIAKQKEKIAKLEGTVQDLTKRLDSKSTMLQKCQKKRQSVELELERAQVKVESLLQGETGTIHQINDLCDLLASKIQELESTTRRMEQLQGELDKTEEELHSVCQSASNDQDKLKEQFETCQARLQEAQATIRKLESDLEEARKVEATLRDAKVGEQSREGNVLAVSPSADQTLELRQAAESEASIVNKYERRLLDLSVEKDGIIDTLRKDMAAIRAKRADEVSALNREIASLRAELEEIHTDYSRQLQFKEQHSFALEQTLHAQEQTMDNMRVEMDQLQNSMRDVASARRSEVEGLQQEVIALKAEISKMEKDASNLRVHLKDEQLARQTEVGKLLDRIAEYECELPKVKAMGRIENDQRILMVKERLEQLRIRNNELKEENKQLGERLEKGIIKIRTLEMKCSQADECKIECEILRRQVAELQETLEENQCLDEVSSLPEMEMSTTSTGGKSSAIRPNLKLAVDPHARATRRSIPVGKRTSLSRIFARPKFSSASKAALMIEAR